MLIGAALNPVAGCRGDGRLVSADLPWGSDTKSRGPLQIDVLRQNC